MGRKNCPSFFYTENKILIKKEKGNESKGFGKRLNICEGVYSWYC